MRIIVKSDSRNAWISIRAEYPEGQPGLRHLWFVIDVKDLDRFAHASATLGDLAHQLDISGDKLTFFDLPDLYGRGESGDWSVSYRRVRLPQYARRMIVRWVRMVIAIQRSRGSDEQQETETELAPERLQRWERCYSRGTGKARLQLTPEARALLRATKDRGLLEQFRRLMTITRNCTRHYRDSAECRISKDWDGFFFSLPGLHGGVINHGRGGPPSWSVHT